MVFKCCVKSRASATCKHLPWWWCWTSSRNDRDIVESYDLGVNSYIVKPVDFDKFVETVQTLGLYWLLLNEPPISVKQVAEALTP